VRNGRGGRHCFTPLTGGVGASNTTMNTHWSPLLSWGLGHLTTHAMVLHLIRVASIAIEDPTLASPRWRGVWRDGECGAPPPARLHSAPSGPEGAEWGCGVRSGNGGVRTGGVGCTIGTTTTHQHINLPSGEGSCNKKARAPVIFVKSILTFPIGVEGV
jgi:hypothetical protein